MYKKENNFLWLLKWYQNQCYINEKNAAIIKIETLDNPGWYLTINLENNLLKDKIFKKIEINRTENDWLFCYIKNNKFEIPSGLFNIIEGLAIFKKWVLSFEEENLINSINLEKISSISENKIEQINDNTNDFLWLLKWYNNQCNGYWEHSYRIDINTVYKSGWHININLGETVEELQNEQFDEVVIKRTDQDWLFCRVRNQEFEARCGALNLPEVINIFRKWVTSFEE